MAILRILVTGAGGFIGSHVVDELLKSSNDIFALCKYNGEGKFGWLEQKKYFENEKLSLILGDISDTEQMSSIIENMDIVINLAALIGIPYSYVAPRSNINTNYLGVLNLLEATRRFNVKLVHISTSEVYGSPLTVPIGLNHHINPQSPYASSKSAADLLCKSFANSFDAQVLIVSPFNTFGPRQSMRAVIPTVLQQIALGKGIVKVGSLHPKRDFTYVGDTAFGIVSAAKSQSFDGSVIQLGTGTSYSVQQILDKCKEVFNVDFEISLEEERVRPMKSEIDILESDWSSARDLINWAPRYNFSEGLKITYEWVKEKMVVESKVKKYII